MGAVAALTCLRLANVAANQRLVVGHFIIAIRNGLWPVQSPEIQAAEIVNLRRKS